MALMEFFTYDSVEIFNNVRLDAYIKNMRLSFVKCADYCDSLPKFLDDWGHRKPSSDYTFPWDGANKAPWYDPAMSLSREFAGALLLDVSNIGSSTRTGSANEYMEDGGWVQGSRRSSRQMVFRALLVGTTLQGARYGLTWLSSVLTGGDVCRHVIRVRPTYADISFQFSRYKRDQVEVIPDNVFQANQMVGIATGPSAAEGNTYGNFRDVTVPALFPTQDDGSDIYSRRQGIGYQLDFLIDCPDPSNWLLSMRTIHGAELMAGPSILSEHVLNEESCDDGAWVEVEFTLLARNPGVWWRPRSVSKTESSELKYSDFLDCGANCACEWLYYKGGSALPVNDDLYDAPVAGGRSHTYGGLLAALWDCKAYQGAPRAVLEPASAVTGTVEPRSTTVLFDPSCPAPANIPGPPQSDEFCPPPYEGAVNRFRYEVDTPTMPRFMFTAIGMTVYSPIEVRDLMVTILPQLGQADQSRKLSYRITWVPADTLVFMDGLRRRTDYLLSYKQPVSQQEWVRADHLVTRAAGDSRFDYPEFICGSRSVIYFDIPVAYDAAAPIFDIWTTLRDV